MVKHANVGVMLHACSDVTVLGIGSTQEADSSRAWPQPLQSDTGHTAAPIPSFLRTRAESLKETQAPGDASVRAEQQTRWLLPLRLGIPLPHAAESRGRDELFKPMSVTDP